MGGWVGVVTMATTRPLLCVLVCVCLLVRSKLRLTDTYHDML